MSLKLFAAQMPRREGKALVPVTSHRAITPSAARPTPYVWPDVVSRHGGTEGPIRLIMAPGAMGKSTAAESLAAHANSPYVDLSKLQVGSGSLTGELPKALGTAVAQQYTEDLRQGRASLILDGTDEAQLAAGRDNFLAFLDDLAWNLTEASASSQVVLLGRRDAIETTYLSLDSIGYDCPIYEMAPLSRVQANELIDLTLDAGPTGKQAFDRHRVHAGPFAELRDEVYAQIAKALEPDLSSSDFWSEVQDFLGYPPVLLALAERLRVENPRNELSRIAGHGVVGQRLNQGALLQQVVESILERESGKVQSRLSERFAIRIDDPSLKLLYGRDEQVIRLLAATGTEVQTPEAPASLTSDERSTYEQVASDFLLDHPLLLGARFANVVFSDYARAWALTSPMQDMHALGREPFLRSLPTVGPFFVHFIASLSSRPEARALAHLREDLVDSVVKSVRLGTGSSRVSFVEVGELAKLLIQFDTGGAAIESGLIFNVTELSGALRLSSPLSRFTLITDAGVILAGLSGHLDLGPDVAIIADVIEIEAHSVAATAGNASKEEPGQLGVMLHAATFPQTKDIKVAAYPEDSVLVSWPEPWHQWKPFVAQLQDDDYLMQPRVSAQALLGLRRILSVFRPSMTEEPSVFNEKMERYTLGDNDVFRATFTALVSLGVISKDGTLFHLRLSALSEYGVSWSGIHGDPGRVLDKLLHAVLSSTEFVKYRIELK